jgi:hypothetical protein
MSMEMSHEEGETAVVVRMERRRWHQRDRDGGISSNGGVREGGREGGRKGGDARVRERGGGGSKKESLLGWV